MEPNFCIEYLIEYLISIFFPKSKIYSPKEGRAFTTAKDEWRESQLKCLDMCTGDNAPEMINFMLKALKDNKDQSKDRTWLKAVEKDMLAYDSHTSRYKNACTRWFHKPVPIWSNAKTMSVKNTREIGDLKE